MKHLKILSFALFFIQLIYAQNAKDVVSKMLTACDNIKTLRYTLKKWERIKGKSEFGQLTCTVQKSPFKVYIYNVTPNPGAEVLYETSMGEYAKVNPAKFPYINLNLHIDGGQLRDKQHHNIKSSGFDYFAGLIRHSQKKFAAVIDKALVLEGTVTWNNKPCYKMVLNNPDYKFVEYTMQGNETVLQAANKLYVNEYRILELNPSIVDDAYDTAPGKKLKVPSDYGKRIVLYVDKATNLPLCQFIYDEIGLYEQYEFYDVQVNPTLAPKELTADYEKYKF